MNEFLTLAFNIFILAIISCIIDNLTINEKILNLLKPAISVMIILFIINYLSNIDFKNRLSIDFNKFSVDTQEVWNSQARNCEMLLEKEILRDCKENGLNVSDINVEIICNDNTFKITSIHINGIDKISAKNYISGKYRIGLSYIST